MKYIIKKFKNMYKKFKIFIRKKFFTRKILIKVIFLLIIVVLILFNNINTIGIDDYDFQNWQLSSFIEKLIYYETFWFKDMELKAELGHVKYYEKLIKHDLICQLFMEEISREKYGELLDQYSAELNVYKYWAYILDSIDLNLKWKTTNEGFIYLIDKLKNLSLEKLINLKEEEKKLMIWILYFLDADLDAKSHEKVHKNFGAFLREVLKIDKNIFEYLDQLLGFDGISNKFTFNKYIDYLYLLENNLDNYLHLKLKNLIPSVSKEITEDFKKEIKRLEWMLSENKIFIFPNSKKQIKCTKENKLCMLLCMLLPYYSNVIKKIDVDWGII